MDHADFRRRGHELIDWLADYRESVASRPVMAQTAPGDIRAKLPADPPPQAEPFEAIVASATSHPTARPRACSAIS
jgi:aromatic-L-amino-acid decarboxylase